MRVPETSTRWGSSTVAHSAGNLGTRCVQTQVFQQIADDSTRIRFSAFEHLVAELLLPPRALEVRTSRACSMLDLWLSLELLWLSPHGFLGGLLRNTVRGVGNSG